MRKLNWRGCPTANKFGLHCGVQNAVAREYFCMDAISRLCSETSDATKLAWGSGLSGFPVVAELARVSYRQQIWIALRGSNGAEIVSVRMPYLGCSLRRQMQLN